MMVQLCAMGKLRHRGPGSRPDGDSKAGAPKEDGTEQRWLRWGALSMAGIIALFLSLLMLRTNQTNRPETVLPMLAGGPSVAVWQWTPDQPFADKAVEYGRPIVFKNSVVTTWPAASRWSTKYLAHKMGPTLANVYQNNKSRHFGPYYDPGRPLAPLFPTPPGVYNDNATAPITKLLRVGTATVDGEGPWTYYSGELDRFGEWAFRDVEPYAELIRPMPERSSINLWIGTDGVTAHCHYDGYHNFYAQIRGRKRFTVLDPSQSKLVRPYPFLHPCHAQCQVNLSDPAIGAVAATAIELGPGDLMYLPPLYFHHVVSQESSVSVNAWTDSTQTELAGAMLAHDLPQIPAISGHIAEAVKGWAAIYIVLSVLARCKHTRHDPVGFVSDLVEHRYARLLANNALPDPPWSRAAMCNAPLQTAGVQALDVTDYSKMVCRHADLLPSSTATLWLGNYVEGAAALALQGAEYVGPVLARVSQCDCDKGVPQCRKNPIPDR